ncbi:MAG: hypothetical protein SPI44_04030 [Bacilli bacterium]|nr:hypothetical protein [Bacilli bacterium]
MNSEINNQSVNNMPVQEGSVDGVSNNVAPVQTVPEQNVTPNVSPNVDSQLQTGQGIVSIQSVQPQPVVQTNEEPVQVQQLQPTTLVAPSKEVQTTISGIFEGMAQINENENVNPIINEGVANTDNGIREEVKLDTNIAMEGVPTINNSNVSVAVPTHEQKDISEISNQAVINTQKSKTSNTIIVVLLIIMAVCVFFIDDILGYFNTNFAPSIKDNKEEELSNNLIDGYIKLGDPVAYMKTGGIKFYNFSLSETNKVILSFLSDKKLDETSSLGYYIVLYNSEKEITYKELFSIPKKIEANEVSQYKISLDVDVYEDSKYAKIIKYTDEELAKKYKIVCSYNIENNDIKLNYQNTYAFENDLLVSYTIVKDYSLPDSKTEDSKKYKNELDNENAKITEAGIKTEYNNNKLTYSVNMNKIPEGFVPLYKNTATKTMIIKKEKLKKWECK